MHKSTNKKPLRTPKSPRTRRKTAQRSLSLPPGPKERTGKKIYPEYVPDTCNALGSSIEYAVSRYVALREATADNEWGIITENHTREVYFYDYDQGTTKKEEQ